jgi:hypothetical protein
VSETVFRFHPVVRVRVWAHLRLTRVAQPPLPHRSGFDIVLSFCDLVGGTDWW